ncbi:MAG: hypothetical protein ACYC27_15680 [Armatimonadota bacterium]
MCSRFFINFSCYADIICKSEKTRNTMLRLNYRKGCFGPRGEAVGAEAGHVSPGYTIDTDIQASAAASSSLRSVDSATEASCFLSFLIH